MFPMDLNHITDELKRKETDTNGQYDIECDLLDRATATGKEVVFYTVNFVCDD